MGTNIRILMVFYPTSQKKTFSPFDFNEKVIFPVLRMARVYNVFKMLSGISREVISTYAGFSNFHSHWRPTLGALILCKGS